MMLWLKAEYTAETSDYLYIISGSLRDIALSGGYIGLISLILIPVSLISKKTANILLLSAAAIFAIFNGILSYYFLDTQVPLDEVVLYYSINESLNIIINSGGFNIWSLLFTFLPLIFIMILYVKINNHKKHDNFNFLFPLLPLMIFLFNSKWMNPDEFHYDNERQYYESVNYIKYFVSKVKKSKTSVLASKNIDLSKLTDDYHKIKDKLHFFNKQYSFFHNTKYPDVLSSYFKPFDTGKPNFVFILFESLGSAYSGPAAKTLSVTPFIDSIAKQSLYWPNCLSGAERTFGVLPGIFSSFTSFTDAKNNMPAHYSLLQYLDSLDYEIAFFYGGDPNFNGMKQYININNGKLPLTNTDMSVGTKSEDPNNNWGWEDDILFKNRINNVPIVTSNPFIDIYLTLSSHAPYTYKNKDYWEEKYIKYIEKSNAPHKTVKKFEKYKVPMAAVMYADNSLRLLFDFYKKSSSFENTIFIITGDHHIGVIPTRNSLDKYNIPLIIYSKKLKKSEIFKSVVSHFDLTPSILSFLKTQTKRSFSDYSHWMGTGLDTNRNFVAAKRNIFVRNSREINDFIYDSLYISNGKLYKIDDNLVLSRINDTTLLNKMSSQLETVKDLFKISVQQNMIVPLKFQKDRKKISLSKKIFADLETVSSINGFKKGELTSKNVINGKTSAILKENKLYGNLVPNYEFDENYKKIEVKIKFDYKLVNENSKKLPSVIIIIKKDDKKTWYEGVKLKPGKYNKKDNGIYTFYVDEVFRPDKSIKWNTLKVYLYNPDKSSIIYDDIEYELLGIP
jgi:uncharacterized sulfatase